MRDHELLKPKILLVNPNAFNLLALESVLLNAPQAAKYDVIKAASRAEALRAVVEHPIAVILLDLDMPGMDGFKTAKAIRQHPHCAWVPIIFITGHYADEHSQAKGYQHGATDYLAGPLLPQILHCKVAVFVELAKKNLHLEFERRQAEQRARELATRDPLTGLMNRRSLAERLEHAIAMAARHQQKLALLFIDVDKFNSINDMLGHDAGDELLHQVSKRISCSVRQSDIVGRLGGDVFMVLMEGVPSEQAAGEVGKKIIGAIAAPFHVQGQRIKTSASAGISLYPQDGMTGHSLMRNADLALYHAKKERRSHIQFFHEEINARMLERCRLEEELQHALLNDEFELYYQPKVDAASGRVAGVEALLRWHHPRLGLLSGGQFIPAASQTKQLVPIGEWVISAACAQARQWRDTCSNFPLVPIAVNVAIPQIYADLPQVIYRELARHNVPASCLQLEITESLVIRDVEKATQVLREISESGITIAIDDFGTGYSSLSVLKALPIDILKIDQSFVRDLGKNLGDNAIVEAIVNMARALALRVVAEGVETQEQLTILRELGCDEHQGYFYSRPLPAHVFAERHLRANAA